jgi:quercetin dioxygenase-like cupin family protein
MDPVNVDELETVTLTSSSIRTKAEWTGGYFAYGGSGADKSATVYFAIPPGKTLGRHTDTAEEVQFILGGSGNLVLDDGTKPVRAGDVVVLTAGTMHDLHNTGSEELRVVAFFAAPQVEQHWTQDAWQPDGVKVTGTPNR